MTERTARRWKRAAWGVLAIGLLLAALPPERDPVGARAGQPLPGLPAAEPVHHVLLIGDTGKPDPGGEPVLNVLRTHALRYGERSTAVFLGDNVYQYGILPPDAPGYATSVRRLTQQLDSLAGYAGRVRFVPGNHDWGHGRPGGATAARRQAAIVEARFPGAFPVSPGGPTIHVDTLAKGLALVSFDTAWWLYEDAIPSPERMDSTIAFGQQVDSVMARLADQTVVMASHHPMLTNSVHGGHFPLRSHVYPLTELHRWAYLPLPGLGTLALAYVRWRGASIQDTGNPRYRALARVMRPAAAAHPRTIYATGHEHTLQHFDLAAEEGTHYVVSGAGCEAKQDPVLPGGALAWGLGQPGIGHVRFYADGQAWLDFVTPLSASGAIVPGGVVRYRARLF